MNSKRVAIKKRKAITCMLVLGLLTGYLLPINAKMAKAPNYGLIGPITDGDTVTWDCVWFGNYWQQDTDGDLDVDQRDAKQPIKWRVLSVKGNDAFLLADQNLDVRQYHKMDADVTWETSSMRSWLNSTFYENAFSGEEQDAIITTLVENKDNPYCGTEGGNDTRDKVYLLSQEEVRNPAYGFPDDLDGSEARIATNTEYVADGGGIHAEVTSPVGKANWWWLRSVGETGCAHAVDEYGLTYDHGNFVSSPIEAVRPVLHLDLSCSVWSLAGTVKSRVDFTG